MTEADPPAGSLPIPQPESGLAPPPDWPPVWPQDWPLALLVALVALGLSASLSALRTALERSSRPRVLARARSDAERERILPLLQRAGSLAMRAGASKLTADLVFTALVLGIVVELVGEWSATSLLVALAVAVPTLLFTTEVLAGTLARIHGDPLLLRFLPVFYALQRPFTVLFLPLEYARRVVRRALGMKESTAVRELVEDLRDVVVESDREGDLDASEREIIENVMEFHDVDAAEIMTPRTEIVAVDTQASARDVIEAVARSGHSRIPVYDGNLDSIVGSIAARDLIQHLSERPRDEIELSSLVRPATFVPETKLVSELLGEFRREKQKMAIVLDEYGGTSGLVTMGDILTEIVGDIQDEFDPDVPEPIVHLAGGVSEVDAATRISEVNEELDLELPEGEDFETLAGYVLAVLGRFPKVGESFEDRGCEFKVLDASDRRVLRVHIRRLAPHGSG